ncbi:MAG: hypothetical protein HOU81_26940 [Hamadaea sp.]|uniref:hypothetical protein n=1 Tax=Hamadaea sp. TaxID=2024425 RepID=UPI0017F13C32|nr:hypothetical protein [Hamadaea sp.]NUR74463.1 hypothetical protein [Hamadaea sp.]NUT22863.1 hypothetical protein [Hamadaea sp.]
MADPRNTSAQCRNCGCDAVTTVDATVGHVSVPAARTGEPDSLRPVRRTRDELDAMGDEETWLWRLVDEADRVFAAAPEPPPADRLAEAERQYSLATAFEERIHLQIRAAQTALASPLSWLRPSHRAALVRQLKRDRATAVIAAVQRRRAAEVRARLRSATAKRAGYLAEHQVTLAAGRNARSELVKLIDELIEGYASLTDQPAWFRYGIGSPTSTPNWLTAARQAVAKRRRSQLDEIIPRELA